MVEPGNPFGFDAADFEQLLVAVRDELGPECDVRVGYREQAGAAVTLYEVVNYWLSWKNLSTAAEGAVASLLLQKTLDWRSKRREEASEKPLRPIWINVYAAVGKVRILGQVRINDPGGEVEYGPFSGAKEDSDDPRKPPPERQWPPRVDLPLRPGRERANRRAMLEAIHAMVLEAQEQEEGFLELGSATLAGIGERMRLNTAESNGLFRRLVEAGYVHLRGPLKEDASGGLHAEVEYLTDRGLEEIGAL